VTPWSGLDVAGEAMQDFLAIAIAVVAGCWLLRTLWRQLSAPPCGTADTPPGTDGFVPLDALSRNAARPTRPAKPNRAAWP
jgi:hypothetical protein